MQCKVCNEYSTISSAKINETPEIMHYMGNKVKLTKLSSENRLLTLIFAEIFTKLPKNLCGK
jgi:hypothetical protein